jgi:formylglycine-generating enzyme required for sulfatase activity
MERSSWWSRQRLSMNTCVWPRSFVITILGLGCEALPVQFPASDSHRASKVFKDCGDCPDMVIVPAGSFFMGSPSSEEERSNKEGPQHQVVITKPFAVGKYEVTRGEYARFVAEMGHHIDGSCVVFTGEWTMDEASDWRFPRFEQTDRHPVVCVSRQDAKEYVAWLAKKTGKPYRLLSEAEWEYAARAGNSMARFWGDDANASCQYANGGDLAAKAHVGDWQILQCNDGQVYTAPVGSFLANDFGLHDMLGNAWEWVEDKWHDSYVGAPVDGSAWGTGANSLAVMRGGSWTNGPLYLRSSVRGYDWSGFRSYNWGFRVARALTP